MSGLANAAKWYTCIFLLMTWIDQAKALGCDGADPILVVNICEGQVKTAPRLFLDMTSIPDDTFNCSCSLTTSADYLNISLYAAPNYSGCQSSLAFMTSSPITFECLLSGINTDVSSKKQFDVNFRRTMLSAVNNYCADIRAHPSAGGSFTTLTLNCPSSQPTTSTSTSTSTSTTTSTTTTSTTTTTTTTPTPTTTLAPPVTFQPQTTSQGQVTGEITTDGQTTVTEETTSQTTTYINTGFPSSVSQTAIIIICAIVGAGLLVGILIAVVAILGKRNESTKNKDKHRFSVPRNSNFELAAENGTANGNSSAIKDKNTDQLHRTPASSAKSKPSHIVYENNGYVSTESNKDTLVVSDRL